MKTVNMSFLNIMLCYYFSLEVVSQGVSKNTPNEKQINCRHSGDFEACAGVKTHRRENAKFIVTNCKDLSYKLQLLASEYQKQSHGRVL